MLIVTLSSVPPRFPELGGTLKSLLRQTADIAEINLYIPERYRRFPEWDGTLPEVPEGISVRRVKEDYGPSTKVLAAAKQYRGQDVELLLCDDDRVYPKRWAARFLETRKARPDAAIANLGWQTHTSTNGDGPRKWQPRTERSWRITDAEFQMRFLWKKIRAGRDWRNAPEPNRRIVKRSGYVDVFEGCAGVLVKPDWFDDVAFDIPPVLWSVDDVWLSGMLARRDIPIWVRGNTYEPGDTDAEVLQPLWTAVIDGADRPTANRMGVEYMQKIYGVWL